MVVGIPAVGTIPRPGRQRPSRRRPFVSSLQFGFLFLKKFRYPRSPKAGFFLALIPLALVLAGLGGCAGIQEKNSASVAKKGALPLLAVLPVENLSGEPAPIDDLHQALVARLRRHGLRVLPDVELEAFMARHWMRHVGGINRYMARLFHREIGVDGIVITYLEGYRPYKPVQFAAMMRLVMVASPLPQERWMDSAAATGDEAPGLLNLGLVNDVKVLQGRVFKRLTGSLADYFAGSAPVTENRHGFPPRIYYRSPALKPGPGGRYKVAVLPFVNDSKRRFAGELIGLHFLQHLVNDRRFQVLEPGIVRQAMLDNRIVLPQGLSVADTRLLFAKIHADLLVAGTVVDFVDPGGRIPSLDFQVYAISRKKNKMVWSSQSIDRGDEGLHFFGLGRIHTASELASLMTGRLVQMLAQPSAARPAALPAARPAQPLPPLKMYKKYIPFPYRERPVPASSQSGPHQEEILAVN